jgi:ABC-type microcin C transport system duplicated ATPase subunit YejF
LKPGPTEQARTVGHVSHATQVRVDRREQIFTSPSADYTRKLLANTPSIEVALGHVTTPSA